MLGGRLGVLVDERERRGGDAVSFGTWIMTPWHHRARLLIPSPELNNYLAQFVNRACGSPWWAPTRPC